MNTIRRTTILFLFAILLSGFQLSVAQTSVGTDFWLTFMDNVDTTMGSQALSIFATSDRPCSATVTNPNTGWSQTFAISPTTDNRVYIPLSQAFTTTSNIVTNTGLHVTATDTISLYSITQGYPNLDYTCLLPTQMLGTDYIVQTFPAERYSTEFSIVAAEDNVSVSITPTAGTIGGHDAFQPYTVTLPHAGQVCQVCGVPPGDLSGTRITVLNNKKIAVFNGDACVYIPDYLHGPSCDHVVEQAIPINCWGERFVVPPSNLTKNDYVRITAMADNCTVFVNGDFVSTLSRAETHQYIMHSTTSADYIETSQPAMVYHYIASYNGVGIGDPAMTTITPLEQSFTTIRFPVLSSVNITSHWINVICDTAAVSTIHLDGIPMAPYFTPVPSAPGYAWLRRSLAQGSHLLYDSGQVGFVAFLFGSGNRVSYGYSLGFAGRQVYSHSADSADLYVNSISASSFLNGFDVCVHDAVRFEVVADYDSLSVQWVFGDGTTAIPNPATHSFDSAGDYEVCAYVNGLDGEGAWHYDTLCTTIHVHPDYFSAIYDTCVENSLPYMDYGRILYSDVENDTLKLQSVYGCDSVNVLSLKVWYNENHTYDTTVCDTLLPFFWRGVLFPYDSIVTYRQHNVHGADSVVVLNFHTMHCPRVPEEPMPSVDTFAIWVPNVFTPDIAGENCRFRIFCSGDIAEAKVAVYHRWGVFVVDFDGLTQSWDGTMDGTPCEQGTYVYRIKYRKKGDVGENVLAGTVTLLR